MSLLLKYLLFRLQAKTKHGIHSPFVYDLATKVLNKQKSGNEIHRAIELQRKKFLNDRRLVPYLNIGAGTRKGKQKKDSSLAKIARNSLKPRRQAEMLYRIASYFQAGTTLELGTSLGITTMYLASANTNGKVITAEGHPEIAGLAQMTFREMGFKNIEMVEGDFDVTLNQILDSVRELDLIYFDGNHQKSATWNYFNTCLNKSHEATVCIFDDIYWSSEMEEVWEMIKNHPEVTLTIDVFHFGLVFFRKGRSKEHFKVKT